MANLRTINGTELTPEVLGKLADEAEAGYDLSKAKRVHRGRPSLNGSGKSPRLQIRLDDELSQAVHAQAAKENRTISDLTREALRNYVA
jgi:hypothetical protein